MIEGLPVSIPFLFGLTVLATIVWFYLATMPKTFLLIAVGWTILQTMGLQGLYQDTESVPPKIILFGVFPALVLIIITFLTDKGKKFIDSISLKALTCFHTIRIPVEIVLALLLHQRVVSVYMTFEGTNFDLFSGITAPLAVPSPFQKISLDQPNVAVLYFIFNLLPTLIVPIVLLGHLAAIRQLTRK